MPSVASVATEAGQNKALFQLEAHRVCGSDPGAFRPPGELSFQWSGSWGSLEAVPLLRAAVGLIPWLPTWSKVLLGGGLAVSGLLESRPLHKATLIGLLLPNLLGFILVSGKGDPRGRL